MRGNFGGKKPYMAEFEAADELAPDPFAEEPTPHSLPHANRFGTRAGITAKNRKIKSNQAHLKENER